MPPSERRRNLRNAFRAQADPDIHDVVLTTEEEGIAAACGAWLGGQRTVLLMQSSGVGNTINMLSLVATCRFPFLTIITMRGEWAEFNPWQIPMGSIVEDTLKLCGFLVYRADTPEAVNTDPYGAWLFRMKLSAPSELALLLDAAAYEKVADE